MRTESASRSSASTASAPSGDAASSPARERADTQSIARASTAAALILALSATVAGFGLVSPVAHWAIQPVDLQSPLPDENQDAESVVFVVTFAALVPLAAIFAPRALDQISRRKGSQMATGLAVLLGIALCVLLTAVKLGEHVLSASRPTMLFVASAVWFALAAAGLRSSLSAHKPPDALARIGPRLWPALAVSLAVVVLCFADLGSITLVPLMVGLALAVAVGYSVAVMSPSFRVPPRALRWDVDVAAVALITLAVPNLVVFNPEHPSTFLETTTIQFHQNFFLGPANELVHGGTMLVDVLSQYGVGSIVFLGAVFELIPIGNGTLAIVEAAFSVGVFALAYTTLRLAGVGSGLAWATLAVAIVVLVYNLVYPLGALLQHGAFRFGMPMVILAAAAAETRAYRGRAILAGLQVAPVGIASLWSFEALLYSIGALAGIGAFRAATASAGRLRIVARLALQVLVACAVVQVVFALVTLTAAGQLPDWGNYLTTVREFLTGPVGEITYDFSPWSPGLAVGALYAASGLALVLVVRREPELLAANRPALLVLSGTTGYGLALFSYFVNRSSEHILPYISLPAVMVGTLWLLVLLRDERFSQRSRGLAVGSAAACAALLVAIAWSDVGLRFSQSALAYTAPGGKSPSAALHRLWHLPPLAGGAPDATRMLETYMPDEQKSVVLASPDLTVEALMRTGRVNAIPLSDPWEASFVPDLYRPAVEDAVADLEPGRRMIIDQRSRELLNNLGESAASFVRDAARIGIPVLEAAALGEIAERFNLEQVARAPSGVEVVELRPR